MFITSSYNYGSASKRVSNAGNAVARFARVGEIDKRQETMGRRSVFSNGAGAAKVQDERGRIVSGVFSFYLLPAK